MRHLRNRITLVALVAPCIALAVVPSSGAAQTDAPDGRRGQPDAQALTPAQWQEDLDFLADRIRSVHPAPYRYVSEAAFDSAVTDLRAAIPALSRDEVVVGLLRILALVHDGHTTMPMAFPGFEDAAVQRLGYHELPVRFYTFDEGTYVIGADDPAFGRLVGRRVTSIDGAPIDSVLELAMGAAPTDNRYGALDHAASLLRIPEVLRGLGVAGESGSVALTTESARGEETADAETTSGVPTTRVPSGPTAPFMASPRPDADGPLYLRHPDRAYWMEYVPSRRTMYVQYNAVQNRGEESIEAFFDRAFARAEAERAERFVLDMRYNTGGNNALNWPIIYDIIRSDRFNRRGYLFVVIGRRTYSAAQNGVNWLERHTNAVFVGEPTASHPNMYGDALHFTLPNSGIPFQVSALFWQNHPRDARTWTAPEIYAPATAAAFFGGRDPAMEAIEAWNPEPIYDRLVAALGSGGVEAAVSEYRAFRSDPRNRFVDVEGDLNQLGYTLVRSDKAGEALEVFHLVVEAYPESANAWDSYGEGLWRVGRRDEAVAAYERAVSLDLDGFTGRNATAMLARLVAGDPPP